MSIGHSSPLFTVGKIVAGVLLTATIAFAITALIAFWPDKVPAQGPYYYSSKPFDIRMTCKDCDCKFPVSSPSASPTAAQATTATTTLDSIKKTKLKPLTQKAVPAPAKDITGCGKGLLHLNTLVLILVAIAGFLGNMVYVAKSFTAFIGTGKFDDQWLLWYWVKPFIGSALAVIVYLAFNDSVELLKTPPNLNRIIAIAALTGLFSDQAILKLRDIFAAIVKPNPDPALKETKGPKVEIDSIEPKKISIAGANTFVISGERLNAVPLNIFINTTPITEFEVKPNEIRFAYNVVETDKALTDFVLLITDKQGREIAKKTLKVS